MSDNSMNVRIILCGVKAVILATLLPGMLLPGYAAAEGEVRTAVDPAPPARAAPLKSQTEWRNMGWNTPEAAFETMLWAELRGDWDLMATVIQFATEPRKQLDDFFRALPAEVRTRYGSAERMIAPLVAENSFLGRWKKVTTQRRRENPGYELAYRVVSQGPRLHPLTKEPLSANLVVLRLMNGALPVRPEGNDEVVLWRKDDRSPWGPVPMAGSLDSLLARIDRRTGSIRPSAASLR